MEPAEEATETMRPLDLTWQAGWTAATLQYLNFCEDLVYGTEFDSILKTACRGCKSALDVFDYPTIQARLTEMKTLRDKELDKALEIEKMSNGKDEGAAADDGPRRRGADDETKTETIEDDEEEKEKREVERMLQRGVTLFVEPASQTELKEAILSSRFKDIKGEPDKAYVLIIYDYKQASESQTRPQTRIAPLKDLRMKSMVQATLDARRSTRSEMSPCIMPGDMWMFFDGSRAGHSYMFNNKVFVDEESGTSLPKVARQLRIEYLESAVAERRSYCRRAVASLKSNEIAHIITHDFVRLPQKKKKHFSGTNLGSSLVDVPLASAKETWQMSREAKKDIYGKYQVAVGGKDSDGDDDEAETMMDETPKKQQKLDIKEEVPVFYWQPSGLLCEEILHMYSICAIIDLTAGSGQWALAALKNNIPYFGVVLTASHLTSLREWLISSVLKGQHDETSSFFQRSLKKKDPKPAADPKKNPQKKPKKEDEKKRKKQKKKKGKSSSSDSSGATQSESDSPL
jgi:hypothetical protein